MKKQVRQREQDVTKNKIGKVMDEFKHGELKSSSGNKVTNPKQALAIGLSEARAAGARIPRKSSPKQPSKGKVRPKQ